MKKSGKIISRIALVLILCGFILIGTAIVLGFRLGEIPIFNYINKDMTSEELEFKDDVEQIDINLKASKIKFVQTNGEYISIKVKSYKNNVSCETKNNVLKIDEDSEWFDFSLFGGSTSQIVLYIPEDLEIELVNLEMGAGSAEIEELECDSLAIDVGAGSVQVENITVGNDADLEVGAGEIDIDNGSTGELYIDCGVGKIKYVGEINGDSIIDCGVGEVTLNLDNDEKDFNYYVDGGIGNIEINDSSFESFSNDAKINNSAEQTMELNCGIGDINVYTR